MHRTLESYETQELQVSAVTGKVCFWAKQRFPFFRGAGVKKQRLEFLGGKLSFGPSKSPNSKRRETVETWERFLFQTLKCCYCITLASLCSSSHILVLLRFWLLFCFFSGGGVCLLSSSFLARIASAQSFSSLNISSCEFCLMLLVVALNMRYFGLLNRTWNSRGWLQLKQYCTGNELQGRTSRRGHGNNRGERRQ